ncbi:MAG TPA: SLBB domain-containing protein [Rhodothermales bacterium]|nr:SLBB domain-containing protein [Rhodothermales bacterium]
MFARPTLAQNRLGQPDQGQVDPLEQLQNRLPEVSLEAGMLALEGALDPSEYIVGPGDQFALSIGGVAAVQQVVPITADGSLVLPEVGIVPAAGRTLEEVQRDAVQALRKAYRNVAVDVALVQLRRFYVHISGAVPEPGRYLVQPISRVDDALLQAYASRMVQRPDPQSEGELRIITSATSERPVFNEDFRPSLRTVRLIHRDSTEESLDLMRYYQTGDVSENPYLRDGDVVMVPSYHIERDGLLVTGEVSYPGRFAYRPGDTALDLLELAAGPNELDMGNEIQLIRRGTDGRAQTQVLDLEAMQTGESVPLQPGDRINVVPREIATAQINGLVEYPGTYPIEDGETTLSELIEMAGGLKPDADLKAAFLERRKSLTFKEEGQISDLNFFSRTYLANARGANRLVVNVQEALQPGGEDIVLYDQDLVVFPRDEGTVFITGNVAQPGYVPFVEGQDAAYYIAQAGGKGALSKGVYVFEEGTGQMRTGEESTVRTGDTVFVNREDVAASPEIAALLISDQNARRQARIARTQTIITGLTAITSVVTTVVAIISLRRSNNSGN